MDGLLDPFTFAAEFFEAFQVVAKDGVRLHAVLQATQLKVQFGGWFVREPVNHPFFVAPGDDEAIGPQVGQMFGDDHLGQVKNILKVAHAERPLGQQVQNAEACFIAETAEDLHQLHIQQQTYTRMGICCQAFRLALF